MSPKIPGCFITAATFIVLASIWAKKVPLFIDTLGRSEVFEWGCAISSSAFISVGLLLALHGLTVLPSKRSNFLGIHLWGILLLFCVLGLQFSEYVVFTKVCYEIGNPPNFLSKLVENSRTMNSEDKRQKIAENAYKVYGVTIAYRRDNGDLTYYEPTAQDVAFQQSFVQTNTKNQKLNDEIIGGQLKQMPFVITVEIGAFIITFAVGLLWMMLKKPQIETNLRP